MVSRRATRRRRTGKNFPTRLAVVTAVVLAVAGLSAVAFGVLHSRSAAAQPASETAGATGGDVLDKAPEAYRPATDASATAANASSAVEVPNVVGLPLPEAKLILDAAGFEISINDAPKGSAAQSAVTTQSPAAGTVSARASVVMLSAKKGLQTGAVTAASTSKTPVDDGLVVVIDPGHQRHSDTKPEPIGPGSHTTKAGVSGGTTGVATKLPEYEVALQISMNLKERLEAAGVKVIMTRTTNDVRLTNSERAKIANDAKADLFVRVHCDGSPEPKMAGISTLYPGKNKWTKPYVAESKTAASIIQGKTVGSTGAVNRGINARTDLTGFNYSKMPSVLIETGFMSNPVEDRLLSSPHYQDKLASGMADGILTYLSGDAR